MIELPPAQLRVAEAIRGGASTAEEMSAATGMGAVRIANVLRALGDTLEVPRAAGRGGRLCDVAAVVEAVRAEPGFALRLIGLGIYHYRPGDHDFTPTEPPGIAWPNYGEHELRFRA